VYEYGCRSSVILALYNKSVLGIVWVAPSYSAVGRFANYDIAVMTASAEDVYSSVMVE
jgi:hypothetical protein